MTQEEMDAEVKRRIEVPLPEKHALSYYRVLGVVKGLLIVAGYGDEAESVAVERLKQCKPARRAAHS